MFSSTQPDITDLTFDLLDPPKLLDFSWEIAPLISRIPHGLHASESTWRCTSSFRRLCHLLRCSPIKFYLLFMRCSSTSLGAIIRQSLNLPSTDSTSKAGHCISTSLSSQHTAPARRRTSLDDPTSNICLLRSSCRSLLPIATLPNSTFSTHDKQSKVSVSVLLSRHFRQLPRDLQ